MWLNRSTLLALVMLFATSSIASATPPTARAQHLNATATAYCDRGVTKDGTPVHEGIIAADPRVLPLGSIVHVHVPELAISGIFTVRDTGSAVKGRIVDIVASPRFDLRAPFGFRAPVEVWRKFLSANPPPLFHDFFAMLMRVPDFVMEGDGLIAMQNARALHRIMNLMRETGAPDA